MRGEAVSIKFLGHCRIADLVLLPLIEHPFGHGVVAQLVYPSVSENTPQDGHGVNLYGAGGSVGLESRFEGGFVVGQATGKVAFVRQEVDLCAGGFRRPVVTLEQKGLSLFVVEVQGHECFAPPGPAAEVVVKWQPGELALQVGLVLRAVSRVMQNSVGVVERVIFYVVRSGCSKSFFLDVFPEKSNVE